MSQNRSKHVNPPPGGLRRAALALLAATAVLQGEANAAPVSLEAIRADLESGENTVRIVGFGDSITGVYYHTGSRRAWPELLKAALLKTYPNAKLEIYNAGVSGDTTNGAVSRLNSAVLSRNPHLVVTMFGMNDVVSVPVGTYEANLSSIVDSCHNAGAEVLIMTPNSVIDSPQRTNAGLSTFSQAALNVAETKNTLSVDAFTEWENLSLSDSLEWSLRMSEDIHPNLNGHVRFAELVASEVAGETVTLTNSDVASTAAPSTIINTILRGETLRVVAMPPYDEMMWDIIENNFPGAPISVYTWDSSDRSASTSFAATVQGLNPHLVVLTTPEYATQGDSEDLIADMRTVLNACFPFGQGGPRVVAALPDLADPLATLSEELEATALASFRGRDIDPVLRADGDTRPVEELLAERVFFNAADVPSPTSAPYLVSQPASVTAYAGEQAAFTVMAWGDQNGLSYQWQKNGLDISGATEATLIIDPVQNSDAGSYRVVVTNANGSRNSDVATLKVLAPLGSLPYSGLVFEDGAVGYWRLNETTGLVTKNNGTAGAIGNGYYPADAVKGAEGIAANVGTPDTAVTLVNNRIEIPYSEDINPRGSFTVEFWAKPTGANGSYQTPLSTRAQSNGGWNFYRNQNKWEFWLANGGYYNIISSSEGDFLLNEWSHLAAVFETDGTKSGEGYSGTLSLYVNGLLIQTQNAVSMPNVDRILSIGQLTDNAGGGLQFKGGIDEVAIYPTALSSSRIADHYAVGAAEIPYEGGAPFLNVHPASKEIFLGEKHTLTIELAGNTDGITYAWRKDGLAIPDATDASYTIEWATAEDAGSYDVIVTNSEGSTTSAPAIISVVRDPNAPRSYADLVLRDDPLGYWKLNEDKASTTTVVNSGSVGAAGNGTIPADAVSGATGIRVNADGEDTAITLVNNRIVIPYTEELNPQGSFTLELWAKPTGTNTYYQTPISNRGSDGAGNMGWNLYRYNDLWQFTLWGTGGVTITGTASDFVINEWNHLVATFAADGTKNGAAWRGTLKFFVNGVLVGSRTNVYYTPNRDRILSIGQLTDNPAGGLQFKGSIDEVALYGSALSDDTVLKHYSIGSAPPVPFEDDEDATIAITKGEDGQVTITWEGGTLESSEDLETWTPLPAAVSPLVEEPSGAKFYRVRSN
jgi:acyl-CoA thioesterase-1